MRNNNPLGSPPPETLVLRLGSKCGASQHAALTEWLSSVLPALNWRGHVYIVENDSSHRLDRTAEIIGIIADYLNREKLSAIYVHPFIRMQGSGQDERKDWETLMELTHPFQQEAYEQQSEVRLLILPIIEPDVDSPPEAIEVTADFFRQRLAKPSFYFQGQSYLDPRTVRENEWRIYVNQVDPSPDEVIRQLGMNHVCESILEQVEMEQTDLLIPCRRHLIWDERSGRGFQCFDLWKKGQEYGEPDCHRCISHACLEMTENLRANDRIDEGRQLFLALAASFSGDNDHQEAVLHASMAFEFSASDADRAKSRLHQGLCHLSLGELDKARQALWEGLTISDDPGLFAYHLGTVEFARQDYAGAVSLFERSLQASSPEVSPDDLLFNLGTSCINLEKYHQAREYLDRMEQISAPVRFYQGICDLAEGLVEPALDLFQEALSLDPSDEDLSRIRFYIATCLKESGRYEEAILELERAIEADPQDYMNHNLKGFCLYQLKQHERSIEAFHRALEINPGSAIDYASIGSNLRELDRRDDAIAMYNMALSLDPSLEFARDNIARLKGSTGQ